MMQDFVACIDIWYFESKLKVFILQKNILFRGLCFEKVIYVSKMLQLIEKYCNCPIITVIFDMIVILQRFFCLSCEMVGCKYLKPRLGHKCSFGTVLMLWLLFHSETSLVSFDQKHTWCHHVAPLQNF